MLFVSWFYIQTKLCSYLLCGRESVRLLRCWPISPSHIHSHSISCAPAILSSSKLHSLTTCSSCNTLSCISNGNHLVHSDRYQPRVQSQISVSAPCVPDATNFIPSVVRASLMWLEVELMLPTDVAAMVRVNAGGYGEDGATMV